MKNAEYLTPSGNKLDVSAFFNGKTIRSVDTSACNVWVFHFTDGTDVSIEVEARGWSVFGINISNCVGA
jgi:hypothetical protein